MPFGHIHVVMLLVVLFLGGFGFLLAGFNGCFGGYGCRRIRACLVLGVALSTLLIGLPLVVVGGTTSAQAQVSIDFRLALDPYGQWRHDPRWGEVWVPAHRPRDWRPYTYGHWVYTDEWGWYWVADDAEEDFAWVVYHYDAGCSTRTLVGFGSRTTNGHQPGSIGAMATITSAGGRCRRTR